MSELGDLLELLHRSRDSYASFTGEFHTVSYPAVTERGIKAAMEQRMSRTRTVGERGGSFSGSFFASVGDDDEDEIPEAVQSTVHICVERPDRYREQEGEGEGAQLVVRDGRRWWSYSSMLGAQTNEGESASDRSMVYGEYEVLLAPAPLPGLLQFEPLGTGERAGRPVMRARCRPDRSQMPLAARTLSAFGRGADEIEVDVDRERGVILAAKSWLRGEQLSSIAAAHVAFDEPLRAEEFVFTSPDGAVASSEREPGPRHVPVHKAATVASFPVFVIAGLPEPWMPMATYAPAQHRPPSPEEVAVMYLARDGAGMISVRQCAAGEAATRPRDARPVERTVERDGALIEVLADIDSYHAVRTTREGTQIEIVSDSFDDERLIDLATRLARAPDEPAPI